MVIFAMMKGVYVLLLEVYEPESIQVGKRLQFHFENGFYIYIGSALGGLQTRVARHLRTVKKFHWHIDYLLSLASARKVICAETSQKMECQLAEVLSRRLPSVIGFGCSDCRCRSHLFVCADLPVLT
ncbi:MAG: GIY-YIG nuclease family protein, partial [Chloroflexi bacterium]|nr:GIY-YIG nuclease family protein [Chloroflexota bacterium]